MKVEVKKVNTLKREMRFEVQKERISKVLDEIYGEIGKVAKIKGFRPGKAPRHLLEKSHGRLAREEMIKKIIPEAYQEGIQKENLNPIDFPEIHDVDYKDGILKFTAKLDIEPEIKIKQYKGLKVKRQDTVVTDEELNKTLDFFKKGRGEDKEETKIDDDFAKSMGFPSLDDFKEALKRQLQFDKDRQGRMDVENQMVEGLLKQAKFDVPESLVKKQISGRVEDMTRHLKSHGMSDDDIMNKVKEAQKDIEESAERDVRAFLIFREIAKLENITVNQGEQLPGKVMEFLLKEAQWEEKNK